LATEPSPFIPNILLNLSVEKKSVISKEEFHKQYAAQHPHYDRLATTLQQALKTLLADNNIPYLEMLARVKDANSAYEKIERKQYDQPFKQIED
jgi:ppGpp synthetase/RelA/SpoT-type nucleotidyltranferase